MLKIITILVLMLHFFAAVRAQKIIKDLKIIYADYDSTRKAAIIPDSIFFRKANILFISIPFDTSAKKEKYGFSICWPSAYIHGGLILTINKRQIVFTSEYNSPHPSELYWFADINEKQYQLIAEKINAEKELFKEMPSQYFFYRQLLYKNYQPELNLPKKWTGKKIEKHYADWLKKRYVNLKDLISFINSACSGENEIPFLTEEEFDKRKCVRLAFSQDDLEKQIEYFQIAKNSGK